MRLTLLVAVLLLPFGLAQEPPPVLTLPGALERGVVLNPEVIAARTALRAAERARARTTADPFALRLPKVQAGHALELAQAELVVATGRAQARAARHALALERTALEQAVQGSAGSVPTLAPLLPVEGGLEEGN